MARSTNKEISSSPQVLLPHSQVSNYRLCDCNTKLTCPRSLESLLTLTITQDGNSVLSPVGNRVSIFDLVNNTSRTLPFENRYFYKRKRTITFIKSNVVEQFASVISSYSKHVLIEFLYTSSCNISRLALSRDGVLLISIDEGMSDLKLVRSSYTYFFAKSLSYICSST